MVPAFMATPTFILGGFWPRNGDRVHGFGFGFGFLVFGASVLRVWGCGVRGLGCRGLCL